MKCWRLPSRTAVQLKRQPPRRLRCGQRNRLHREFKPAKNYSQSGVRVSPLNLFCVLDVFGVTVDCQSPALRTLLKTEETRNSLVLLFENRYKSSDLLFLKL